MPIEYLGRPSQLTGTLKSSSLKIESVQGSLPIIKLVHRLVRVDCLLESLWLRIIPLDFTVPAVCHLVHHINLIQQFLSHLRVDCPTVVISKREMAAVEVYVVEIEQLAQLVHNRVNFEMVSLLVEVGLLPNCPQATAPRLTLAQSIHFFRCAATSFGRVRAYCKTHWFANNLLLMIKYITNHGIRF